MSASARTRACTRCGRAGGEAAFHRHRGRLASRCKVCARQIARDRQRRQRRAEQTAFVRDGTRRLRDRGLGVLLGLASETVADWERGRPGKTFAPRQRAVARLGKLLRLTAGWGTGPRRSGASPHPERSRLLAELDALGEAAR